LQVALIIDTLKPGLIIASTVRHSPSALALPKYVCPSSNMLSPQTASQSLYFNPILHKASEDR
jgi:ABC-type Fe3+-citrate transport system substrate-binding protein